MPVCHQTAMCRRPALYACCLQDGTSIQMPEEERRALVTGLALHGYGKADVQDGAFEAALQSLLLAEEALSLCDSSWLNSIDNYAMLLIDIVW